MHSMHVTNVCIQINASNNLFLARVSPLCNLLLALILLLRANEGVESSKAEIYNDLVYGPCNYNYTAMLRGNCKNYMAL